MNLQQLKVFVLACKEKKLKTVAERLDVKQPTVSFHLNRLEEECGVPLFKSSSNRIVELTPEGQALYPYALQMTILAEELEYHIAHFQEKQKGQLRIGSTYTPATYLLPEYLASFKSKHNQIQLSLEVKPAHSILDRLKNYELDLGIISYSHLNDSLILAEELFEDQLVLLLHPKNPLAKKDKIELSDIKKQWFVMHEEGSMSRTLIEDWTTQHNMKLQTLMEVSATETMKEAVKQNIGVAIVSERCSLQEIKRGEVVIKKLPAFKQERFIYMIRHKERVQSPISQSFTKGCVDFFSKYQS
ncbi:LysR family transcriptional regulator [Bacillus horti]|uniref:DNA-binding transcriptional LysR family regulator n=1 Tax=Caldalkalibacillus horti TaxID=77523 RepID=A0ABT9VXW1_9BACI|nr:LysR family transcriptional regulator [Bacillus horti]MDQ0165835.1 DNA-binding transcriptional LysR family regulator [Bacillus horti]